jgi:hypothetical protein
VERAVLGSQVEEDVRDDRRVLAVLAYLDGGPVGTGAAAPDS